MKDLVKRHEKTAERNAVMKVVTAMVQRASGADLEEIAIDLLENFVELNGGFGKMFNTVWMEAKGSAFQRVRVLECALNVIRTVGDKRAEAMASVTSNLDQAQLRAVMETLLCMPEVQELVKDVAAQTGDLTEISDAETEPRSEPDSRPVVDWSDLPFGSKGSTASNDT